MSSKKFKALDGIISSGELQVDGNFNVGGSLTLGQAGANTTQAVRADRLITANTDSDLVGGGNLTIDRVISHANVARANTTSSQTLTSQGQFTALVSISSNARGHITGVNTRTYTLPAIDSDIFKNVANSANTIQFSAAGPNDNIQFAGAGATSVSFDASSKKITYSTSIGNGTLSLGTSGIATGSASFTANSSTNSTFTVNVPGTNLDRSESTTSVTITSSTGSNVTIRDATTGRAGLITTGAQTFAGVKTFNSTISGSINGNAATATTANALNTSNNYRMNSLGVNTNASGTAGEIRATNNITAFFSDERLKTFKGKIQSPLDKINALNGYHYELNELAESFGYSIDKQYVGVSAQEVEAVLPEVVSLAPFDTEFDENGKEYSKSGENYKTVDYSKLVVLLIEGMKEQQNEIQQLKETVNHLKTIIG